MFSAPLGSGSGAVPIAQLQRAGFERGSSVRDSRALSAEAILEVGVALISRARPSERSGAHAHAC